MNAERFITEQLKVFETQVLEAEEKRQELEERLFSELRSAVAAEARRIQAMAEVLAEIDGHSGLAEVAAAYDYCCPQLDSSGIIHILDGRHPVIALPGSRCFRSQRSRHGQ